MKILKWFENCFPDYVKKMKQCRYNSIYHMEGDVWAHTILSYKNAIKFNVNPYVKWALLLHDIGRVVTRKENNNQVSFGDFEGVSIAIALDILKASEFNNDEKVRIIKIIANHFEIMNHIKYEEKSFSDIVYKYKYEEQLLKDLAEYARCDMLARKIHPSKQKYYVEKDIIQFQEKVFYLKHKVKKQSNEPYCLTLLTGVPCSGKSSSINMMESYRHLLVSRDSCTIKIGRLHGASTYDEAFDLKQEDHLIAQQVDFMDEAIENIAEIFKYNVTIDNLNLASSGRKYWVNKKKSTHKIQIIVFLKSFEDLLLCDSQRIGKSVGKKRIINRLKKFQLPLLNDGIDVLDFKLFSDKGH